MKKQQSTREQHFRTVWYLHGPDGGEFVAEHKFHPTRKWVFDFAWPEFMVAVEIEGGTFGGYSRHTTGIGHHRDCEKYNAATLLGWRVLKYTTKDLQERPVDVVDEVLRLIELSKGT